MMDFINKALGRESAEGEDAASSQGSGSEPSELRDNFYRMSIYFALGHGAATTPLVYASSVLDTNVAYVGNGLLYILMLVGALVLSVPVVGMTGLRGGMVLSMGLYGVY